MNYHYFVVDDGIMLDEKQQNDYKFMPKIDFIGDYIMDASEHTAADKCGIYAFNFVAQLLIESGFPATIDTLEEAIMKKTLHPEELAYLQRCLDNPRSLLQLCRDVLRSHYKGRAIHKYVEIVNIPRKVHDYILVKSFYCHWNILFIFLSSWYLVVNLTNVAISYQVKYLFRIKH